MVADIKYREKTTFGVKGNEFCFVDLLNLGCRTDSSSALESDLG